MSGSSGLFFCRRRRRDDKYLITLRMWVNLSITLTVDSGEKIKFTVIENRRVILGLLKGGM